MTSWHDAWADRYDEATAGLTADIPFDVALAREADGLLVELGLRLEALYGFAGEPLDDESREYVFVARHR